MDSNLRTLERQASAGDSQAQEKLIIAATRSGVAMDEIVEKYIFPNLSTQELYELSQKTLTYLNSKLKIEFASLQTVSGNNGLIYYLSALNTKFLIDSRQYKLDLLVNDYEVPSELKELYQYIQNSSSDWNQYEKIIVDDGDYSNYQCYVLYGLRYETDSEYAKRLQKHSKQQLTNKLRQEKKEAKEKNLLNKLLKKYPTPNSNG